MPERGGLGEGSISRRFPQVDAEHDARHTPDADAAREYLSAGARGDDCAHLALKLACVVLARADVKLAFAVLAGGAVRPRSGYRAGEPGACAGGGGEWR
jgi:hypothetical protein